ncbi:coiled-coil and C2 domain-containing protein 1A isoform X1 [Larus michahellis]|uniref:coiled-coil and C2 domain-containing protein 1A isoform X1 n=1 Tax=Larus michahellis TaxID=119627 RepID=UPI003D9B9A08
MSKARRPLPPPGRGAAIARQMGLLAELSPEGTAGDAGGDDAAELEAELEALVGGRAAPGEKPPGKTPLPMEAIERMAALCMKDPDEEEEDEELEDEDDLMAELQEVLGDGGRSADAPAPLAKVPAASPEPEGLESTLEERIGMYRAAVGGAREAGDGARLRRYERGLKTLENMLASVRKGKKIDEEEIPPPVALGKGATSPRPPPPDPLPAARPGSPQPPPLLPVTSPEPKPAPPSPAPRPGSEGAEALLRDRQRGYKLAALRAKQRGDLEAATKFYRVAKSLDALLEAAGQGRPVELSDVPPPPDPLPEEPPSPGPVPPAPAAKPPSPAAEPPPAPRDALEALQQRMERYQAAAAAAKSRGDDRKARMHERIVKQYRDAIRAHRAGKSVDFSELPVPPGFQPIQGTEAPAAEQSLAGALEAAMKLAGREDHEEEEDDGAEEAKPPARPVPARAPQQPPPPPRAPAAPPNPAKPPPKTTPKAQQQLQFLEGRRRRLLEAALGAKQKNDMEGAKLFLRQAKGLEPLLAASRAGLPVDIAKGSDPVPPPAGARSPGEQGGVCAGAGAGGARPPRGGRAVPGAGEAHPAAARDVRELLPAVRPPGEHRGDDQVRAAGRGLPAEHGAAEAGARPGLPPPQVPLRAANLQRHQDLPGAEQQRPAPGHRQGHQPPGAARGGSQRPGRLRALRVPLPQRGGSAEGQDQRGQKHRFSRIPGAIQALHEPGAPRAAPRPADQRHQVRGGA